MAKIYSITARRYIDVPDRKQAATAAIETGSSKVAQQLAGWLLEAEKKATELEAKLAETGTSKVTGQLTESLLEAEKQIAALEGKLATATAAGKAAETEATSARASAEAKTRGLAADLEKARTAMEKAVSDGKVALTRAEGVAAVERAGRLASEQRVKQLESAPKPIANSGADTKQIISAIRAELGARPAAKAERTTYEVDIIERDANGRILRFKPRFTS